MAEAENEFLPTRKSLLSRLKDWDDQESWRDFFNIYWKLIYSVARKAGLTDAEAQDVVQDTMVTVAKKMKGFKYDPAFGSFKGWLLNTTRWRIEDVRDRRLRAERFSARCSADKSPRTSTVDRIPDPAGLDLDALWEDEWQKNLMGAAINRVKTKVSPKQYQIFDLVMKKWSIARITDFLHVNAGQVYLAKHRVTRMLKKEIAYLKKKHL
jgi:RNA polymerase sigma-70 factor (ECF subfamily)